MSYDGMCDPLGASQVLPYLFGLAKRRHQISLISFEKPRRTAEEREAVARACAEAGISWYPLPYHKRPPVLSSIYDLQRMSRLAQRLHKRQCFDLVHCRSYLPALVALRLKRRSGVPFIFDMRGFWADERVDGGQWDLRKRLYRAVYRFFKNRESEFLSEADQVVSLTTAGEAILRGWRKQPDAGPPITVIPCCVDFGAFPPVTATNREAARRALAIAPDATVAAYLGSFGSWYMVEEMMDFFGVQLERDPNAVFLIVSPDPAGEITAVARARGVPAERLIIRAAVRAEVPQLVAAADYALFFIKPAFSKKSSSPTKMGEFLALELPIVTNSGVGDVDEIMAETGAGVVIERFDRDNYEAALDRLDRLKPDMNRWRASSRRLLDLESGIEQYDALYRGLIGSAL
jgi:glycosyltransferase involved in cell wall biosynthesis